MVRSPWPSQVGGASPQGKGRPPTGSCAPRSFPHRATHPLKGRSISWGELRGPFWGRASQVPNARGD
eukprot:1166506-Alexandrium_andersonii.AAC.1